MIFQGIIVLNKKIIFLEMSKGKKELRDNNGLILWELLNLILLYFNIDSLYKLKVSVIIKYKNKKIDGVSR